MYLKFMSIILSAALNIFNWTAAVPYSNQEPSKKYCYKTYAGKYEISLFEGEPRKATYKLYNSYGDLQKIMQGNWVIRDEGVYGAAYVLTLTWSGLNSNMPELKFVCQYDGNGKLQGIIDSQNRTWNQCF